MTGYRWGRLPGWLPKKFLRNTKRVLSRLGVRRNLVGEIINLLREEAELVAIRSEDELSPDSDDNVLCACAEQGRASFIATLNKKHFHQQNLTAKVISPGDPIPTTRRGRPSRGQ